MTTTSNVRFTIECGKSIAFGITDEMLIQLGGHQAAFDHVLMIGLKNLVQDSHASIKREDFADESEWLAASKAKAELKLGAILSGNIRAQSGDRKPKVDDFTNAARKVVLSLLPAEKRKELAAMDDKGVATLDAIFAKNEAKLKPQVEAKMEADRKAAEAKAKLSEGLDLDI